MPVEQKSHKDSEKESSPQKLSQTPYWCPCPPTVHLLHCPLSRSNSPSGGCKKSERRDQSLPLPHSTGLLEPPSAESTHSLMMTLTTSLERVALPPSFVKLAALDLSNLMRDLLVLRGLIYQVGRLKQEAYLPALSASVRDEFGLCQQCLEGLAAKYDMGLRLQLTSGEGSEDDA